MSVKLRSPVVTRKTRVSSARQDDNKCWETSVCSGDRLINEHASRVTWWLAAVLVVLALVLIGVIGQHAYETQHAAGPGYWSSLHASTWIQPTPRALASLIGIALTLDLYSSYMLALKKGHLDKYVGQFMLATILRVGLWIFFLYGTAYGGTIGSMFALITLALVLGWGFLTGHPHSPLHAWITMLELAFVIFLIVWLATSDATIWPSQ